MANWSVEAENLTRKFDDFVAVDHISFRVREGQIFGFLGPNGAGKSTTIRMFLRDKGFEVETATNAEDAVALVRRRPFNLVLLDEQMPGKRGMATSPGSRALKTSRHRQEARCTAPAPMRQTSSPTMKIPAGCCLFTTPLWLMTSRVPLFPFPGPGKKQNRPQDDQYQRHNGDGEESNHNVASYSMQACGPYLERYKARFD